MKLSEFERISKKKKKIYKNVLAHETKWTLNIVSLIINKNSTFHIHFCRIKDAVLHFKIWRKIQSRYPLKGKPSMDSQVPSAKASLPPNQ